MKIGDLVSKIEGRMKGATGVIVEIHNPKGHTSAHTIFRVLTSTGIALWAESVVEVINENR